MLTKSIHIIEVLFSNSVIYEGFPTYFFNDVSINTRHQNGLNVIFLKCLILNPTVKKLCCCTHIKEIFYIYDKLSFYLFICLLPECC